MKCSTILLVSINILFLVVSVLIITSGSTAEFIFGQYYYNLESQRYASIFPTLWITTGCFLMVISIFGIVVAIGESILLINTYAILLSVVLILQVSSAIAGLMLGLCHSKEIVTETLNALINAYEYDTICREAIDWMQTKYQCCGNTDPSDWKNFSSEIASEVINNSSEIISTTPMLYDGNHMPASCCIRGSDYNNFRCEKFYSNGCLTAIQEAVSSNVLIASFLALGLALFELMGAVIAFLVSKTIRRERDIETDYSQLGIKSSYR